MYAVVFAFARQRTYVRHWCARALCLIVVPVFVYMLCFKIHFMILSHSGPGDAQMSSLFQAHLRGNDFSDSPLGELSERHVLVLRKIAQRSNWLVLDARCCPPEAAFGSRLTLKNMGYGGGLLHSHVQTYPVGSQQQQVTCYHYKDNNNEWIVTPKWDEPALPDENSTEPSRMLKNGDVIRLVHHATGRNLHSHPIPAPITKENYEVAGYGDATIGDSNDYWVVELVDDMNLGKPKPGMNIRSLTSRIRFRHQNLGCHLRAANAVLPQWGWKQVEVSCQKDSDPKDDHTYWNIESHWNEKCTSSSFCPFMRG